MGVVALLRVPEPGSLDAAMQTAATLPLCMLLSLHSLSSLLPLFSALEQETEQVRWTEAKSVPFLRQSLWVTVLKSGLAD